MDVYDFMSGCIEVERSVANIYRTFANMFPEEKDFWIELYRDELEHTIWLSIEKNIEAMDLLPANTPLPTPELIESTLLNIRRQAAHIMSNPVTLEYALETALRIEGSTIEVFTNELSANIFAVDEESLQEKLVTAEKIHINKIENLMIDRGFLQLS
jgi:hypothetical protein